MASPNAESPKPTGREDITEALLAATEHLCETGQPSSFTVANIASEADVSTSLLYFYFDSKDDLIIATLRSIGTEVDAIAATADGPEGMATVVTQFFIERPAFPRIIAWLVLEGREITEEMGDHPFMRRLIATFSENDADDPHTQAGIVVMMLVANSFFYATANAALGRAASDQRLIRAFDRTIVTYATGQSAPSIERDRRPHRA
jgi:AcrR family transcriptional regulator